MGTLPTKILTRTLLLGSVAYSAVTAPAFAQQPEIRQPTPETTLGGDDPTVTDTFPETVGTAGTTITVTGSRIARPDLTAPSPVTIIDNEQVALTGTTTLETLLNDLPQLIPGNNRTSNNAGGQTFATLDLRGLGPQRTLILLDGERLPYSSTSGVVDISQIPVGLIERIDVVTGGASAVYGSDAMAGVVNFILRQDFQGIELTGQMGIAEEGVGFNYSVGGLFGGNFADGRGNIVIYAAYYDREGVYQSRFDYSRVSAAVFADPAQGTFLYVVDHPDQIIPGSIVGAAGGSVTPPWGQLVNNAVNPFGGASAGGVRSSPLNVILPGQFAAADTDCNPATAGVGVTGGANLSFNDNGVLTPYFGAGRCAVPLRTLGSSRYNFAPDNFLTIPYDRFNLSTIARYEFNDTTRARLFASYVDNASQNSLAPTPAQGGTGFVVDPTRAVFIPADMRAALDSRSFYQRAGTTARFGTLEACVGTGETPFVCTLQSGANEPFSFDRRFSETGPRLGTFRRNSLTGRLILEHDLSPDWRLSGGVGWGRNQETRYNQGNINRVAVEQGINGCVNAAGVVNGPGILPGCIPVNIWGPNTLTPAMVNFIQTDTIDLLEFEQTRAAVNISGSLWNLPGGPIGVAVGAEARRDVGVFIPDDAKIRGEIIGFNAQQPQAGEITVKEVYGEIRLPLLGGGGFPDLLAVELGGRYSDYDTIGGIFNYKLAAEFAPVRWLRFRGAYNRAARAPNIFELFQAGDQGFPSYTDPCNATNTGRSLAFCEAWGIPQAVLPGFAQSNTQVQAFSFGQADLREETAESYTVGAVFTPAWWPLGRMSLTVDYYDITIRGRIQSLTAQFYINQCNASQNLASEACQRIFRTAATGQIERIDLGRRNSPDESGPFITRGIDVGFNWMVPMGEVFGGALGAGRLRISNVFSWTMDYELDGVEFADTAGVGIGGVISEFGNTLTVAYDQGPFTGQIRWVYASGGEQEGQLFAFGLPAARVPDLSFFDLSLRWQVSERFEFTGIVNNLFDKLPTPTITGVFEQSNVNASFVSPIMLGRTYAIQARVRF